MTRRTRWAIAVVAVSLLANPAAIGAEAAQTGDLTITIVYDNYEYTDGLVTAWGFSALVEFGDCTILFDTGGDGPTLLSNGEALGVAWSDVDAIVLSHEHGDHVGGLESVLDLGGAPPVYVPASFPGSYKSRIRARTELIAVTEPVEIVPGIHSTGVLRGYPDEQALVVETSAGTVVITGCAHPGIVNIVERARIVSEADILLVVGGFHLANRTRSEVQRIAEDLLALGVQYVCPTHCTGDEAIAVFEEAFAGAFLRGGVGRVLALEDFVEAQD